MRGELGDREVRGTLRHQILENLDVAVGRGGVPGSEIDVRRVQRRRSAKALSHIGVYVNGSGAFGDKARPGDK